MKEVLEAVREQLRRILNEFMARSGSRGCALVSSDGTLLAYVLPESVNRELVASMVATFDGTSSRMARQMALGEVESVCLNCREGTMIIKRVKDLIFSILLEKERSLGLVLYEVDRTAEEIAKVMESAPVLRIEYDPVKVSEKLRELEASPFFKRLMEQVRRERR